MTFPTLFHEQECWNQDFLAIGIDEVGRGAFAGPLVMAGVVFDVCDMKRKSYLESLGINDSKKLSGLKREKLIDCINQEVFTQEIFTADVDTINRVGIGVATQMCINEIVNRIREKITNRKLFLLIDGMPVAIGSESLLSGQKAIIGGDGISLSIAAASVLAKVYRDNMMKDYAKDFPVYGFEKHVGYGTKSHRDAILKYGKCELHRDDYLKKLLLNSHS